MPLNARYCPSVRKKIQNHSGPLNKYDELAKPLRAAHSGHMTERLLPMAALTQDMALFDRSNPRSLINIVPDFFANHLEAAYIQHKNVFAMSEREMERYLKNKEKPLAYLSRVRLSFWNEYAEAQDRKRDMQITNIIKGVSSYEHWKDKVLDDIPSLAYVVLMPTDYKVMTQEAHHRSLQEIRDILEMPLIEEWTDKNGKYHKRLNTTLMSQKVKIWQLLEARVKGAIVQKFAIQSRSEVSLHTNAHDANPYVNLPMDQLENIDKQLNVIGRTLSGATMGEKINLLTPEEKLEVTSDPEDVYDISEYKKDDLDDL